MKQQSRKMVYWYTDTFQFVWMASCKDTETQSDFFAGHLWFLGTFGILERLGILFIDRLTLPISKRIIAFLFHGVGYTGGTML
jgi:hypothetical protein